MSTDINSTRDEVALQLARSLQAQLDEVRKSTPAEYLQVRELATLQVALTAALAHTAQAATTAHEEARALQFAYGQWCVKWRDAKEDRKPFQDPARLLISLRALEQHVGYRMLDGGLLQALLATPPTGQAQAEPVAEVLWYAPAGDPFPLKDGHKIIDASLAFFDFAPIGTKLYATPPTAQAPQGADARDAQIAQLREALEMARNGLEWYRDRNPGQSDGSDDEAFEVIDAALAAHGGKPGAQQ